MYGMFKGSVFDPLAENLTESEKIKFLCSDTYRKLLCGLARGLTNNPKAEVIILPPLSSELGYTDGNAYYVCTAHKMYLKLPIEETTGYVIAVAIHEPFHGIYTDFPYWNRRIRSVPKGQSLYKWLFNALCDARIERIGCVEFEGIKHYIIQFREFFFNNATDESELSESQKLLNNILFFATCGKVKYKLNDEMQKAFDECREHIIAGRRADTTAECDKSVAKIFDIVYPLVKNEQDMPDNPTGMMSNQKNSKNFKRNAGTGGADAITFDEDMEETETDESDDSDAEENAGQSGKTSKKSKNSKSSQKSKASKSSDEEDADDDGNGCDKDDKKSDGNSSKSKGKKQNKNSDKDVESDESASNGDGDEDEDGKNGGNGNNQESSGEETDKGNEGEQSSSGEQSDSNASSEGGSNGDDNEDGDEEANASQDTSDSHSKQGGGQGGDQDKTSLAEQEAEKSREFLREALSGIASAYENEIWQKAQDEKRMQKLESDTTYGIKVSCANPAKNNSTLYSEMVTNARPIINHLTTEMKKVIVWNQDELCHKLGRGFLDPQSLAYAYRGTCFGRRIEKSDEADLFISMLVDCSGSMSGQRLMNTAITVAIILEACSALKIPVSIKGFTSDWTSCDIVHFWDYQYKNVNCRENITQIFASGGTPLTEALRYEKNYLNTVKFADKISFVLTDGAPNNSTSAIEAYKQLCNIALVYGVAIGDDIPCLKEIFGDGKFIDARDLKDLPFQIGNIIKKNILRQ